MNQIVLPVVNARAPLQLVPPVALKQALEQSHEIKAKVEACAEDLALANELTQHTMASGDKTGLARQTLDAYRAVEIEVQECAQDLGSVTTTLAQGITELKTVEAALANAKDELAETNASLASALAGEECANHRAMHDHLTGLPNRALFDDRLARALALATRHDWTVAVMFLDLDRFKQVNDVHGHAAGDLVLKEVARRLAQNAREEDTVCRNGGDEFLYLLMNPQGRNNVERIAADVIENLSRKLCVGKSQLSVRPSIGIAIYPDGGVNGNELIDNADAAMYRAKKNECGYAVHAGPGG